MKNKLKFMSAVAVGAIASVGFVGNVNASVMTLDAPAIESSNIVNVHDHMADKAKEMKDKSKDKEGVEDYAEEAVESVEEGAEEAMEESEDAAEYVEEEAEEAMEEMSE